MFGFQEIGRAVGDEKSYKFTRFDVLRVATGSYTVEKKRIASRKLFRQVPGLQDVKNEPKRTENVQNQQKSDFAVFRPIFPLGQRQMGR